RHREQRDGSRRHPPSRSPMNRGRRSSPRSRWIAGTPLQSPAGERGGRGPARSRRREETGASFLGDASLLESPRLFESGGGSMADLVTLGRSWGSTDRRDAWWAGPAATFVVLSGFVVYATVRALMNRHYAIGELLSPLYSPNFGD